VIHPESNGLYKTWIESGIATSASGAGVGGGEALPSDPMTTAPSTNVILAGALLKNIQAK
jgi:hypothetical protein